MIPASLRSRAAETVQRRLRRLGYELKPYAPATEVYAEDRRRAKLLRSKDVDVALDVGANRGQYAKRLRASGFRGPITSFEPLSEAYSELARQSASDPDWRALRLALGDEDGTSTINVAANSWSSSLLPMGARHLESAPESAYVGSETVPTARLDSIWNDVVEPDSRVFLKLDVQGFEMHVLRGVEQHINDVEVIQAEMSLVPLYEGDTPWRSLVDHLAAGGFELGGLEPGFEDPATGRMLQADGIFVRAGRS